MYDIQNTKQVIKERIRSLVEEMSGPNKQEQFAEKSLLSTDTIKQLSAPTREINPRIDTLLQICNAGNCELPYLLGIVNEKKIIANDNCMNSIDDYFRFLDYLISRSSEFYKSFLDLSDMFQERK